MKFSSLALLACLAVSPVFAGGESGGGGGGICYNNGKCVTLAQAGLRIDETQTSYFELEQAIVDDIKYIVNSIKVDFNKNALISDAIGIKETFSVVSPRETKRFDKFKKDYLSILSQQTMDTSGFDLLAVSTTQSWPAKTYLLPGYEKLDVRGKALLLIHEANIRRLRIGSKTSQKSLKDVLKFDGVLLDALKANEEGQSFDQWKMVEALESISLINNGYDDYIADQADAYIKTLLMEKGAMPMSSFCSSMVSLDEYPQMWEAGLTCHLSQEKVLALRSVHPRSVQVLSGKSFDYVSAVPSTLEGQPMEKWGKPVVQEMTKICNSHKGENVLAAIPTKGKVELYRLVCK